MFILSGAMFDLSQQLSVSVLGSSSSGNSTLVQCGSAAFLVDCGFPPAYIATQLAKKNLRIGDLKGILITHTHGDHLNQSFVAKALREGVAVYCPPDIELHLQAQYRVLANASRLGLLRPIRSDEMVLDQVLIRFFDVPHDSPGGCFGYSIYWGSKKVTVVTDLAHPTPSIIRQCANSDILVIESNHDVEMLERSRRPIWLKRRIREFGHLSNDQCAEALLGIIDNSTRLPATVMLAHVSRQCNRNAIAIDTAERMLRGQGIHSVNIAETFPFKMNRGILIFSEESPSLLVEGKQ